MEVTTRSQSFFSRKPGLKLAQDGGYTCDSLDDFLKMHGLALEGLEAHVIGPSGYLNTVTVGYPIPSKISFPVRSKNGACNVELGFSELWLEFLEDKLYPFAIYDCENRSPSAHLKVDH